MVKSWEPGTDYERGDVVKYHGHQFKAIQKHSSLGTWTPGVTPALWGMLEEDDDCDDDEDHQADEDQEQQHGRVQVPVYHRPDYRNDDTSDEPQYEDTPQPQNPPRYPSTPQYQNTSQHQNVPQDQNASQYQNTPQQQNPAPTKNQSEQGTVQQGKPPKPTEEEKKTHWYDLSDDRKQQLKIGGAIVAGLGLAGAGYGIWKHHEKSEEEKDAHAWAIENWVKDAQVRTDKYHNGEKQGPATWILTHGKNIPQDAIVVGQEHDWTLYICRAYYEGGKQIGKASQAFEKGGVIGYLHHEVHVDTFEVLVGDMYGLRWEPCYGRLNLKALGYKPVEGGNENDGTPLYIVKAPYNGFVHPGKTSEKLDGAYIPYDGTEKNVKEYSVLCYNNPDKLDPQLTSRMAGISL